MVPFSLETFWFIMLHYFMLNQSCLCILFKQWNKTNTSQLLILDEQLDPYNNFTSYRILLQVKIIVLSWISTWPDFILARFRNMLLALIWKEVSKLAKPFCIYYVVQYISYVVCTLYVTVCLYTRHTYMHAGLYVFPRSPEIAYKQKLNAKCPCCL
jgi:hypothetical protein